MQSFLHWWLDFIITFIMKTLLSYPTLVTGGVAVASFAWYKRQELEAQEKRKPRKKQRLQQQQRRKQRKDENKVDNNNSSSSNNSDSSRDHDDDDLIPPIRIYQDNEDDKDSNNNLNNNNNNYCISNDKNMKYILSLEQMQQLACNHVIPFSIAYCGAPWKLLYSLARHGDAFDTFVKRVTQATTTTTTNLTCNKKSFLLFVIETSKHDKFGALIQGPLPTCTTYASSPSCSTTSGANSCLFKFVQENQVKVFPWTGATNAYVTVCNVRTEMLAFGGGGDNAMFGLCLQDHFQRGTTGHCDTFANEPLCGNGIGTSSSQDKSSSQLQEVRHEEIFHVVNFEVWTFLSNVF